VEKLKFGELDHVVEIDRAQLQKNDQELLEFAREVWEGVVRSAPDFGARPGQVFVRAIFGSQVVVMDEGNNRFVRMDMRRDKTGALAFKNAKVVKQEWIEQGDVPVERSEDAADESTPTSSFVSIKRVATNIWGDLVGIAV
jgi:hypothetical protein